MENGRFRGLLFRYIIYLLAGSSVGVVASGENSVIMSADQARDELRMLKERRWSNASWVEQIGPFYSILRGVSARLLILSRFADPVTVEVTAYSASGAQLDLGSYVVAARETVTVDLNKRLSGNTRFSVGSLSIRFFGDNQMIQGWLVNSGLGGVMETPLENPVLADPEARFSFWISSRHLRGRLVPRLFLFNAGAEASEVSLAAGPQEGGFPKRWAEVIPPRRPYEVSLKGLSAKAGKLRLITPPEVRIVATMFSETETLARLPLEVASARPSKYDSLLLPETVTDDLLELQLLNTRESGDPVTVAVTMIAFDTGEAVWAKDVSLAAGSIAVVDLRAAQSMKHAGPNYERVRIHLEVETGKVIPSLLYRTANGMQVDLALFNHEGAHSNGMYPIPSLEDNDVHTTLVNIGMKETHVVGHLDWGAGEYSIGPFWLAPGAGHQINFKQLMQDQDGDFMNRRIATSFEQGFFQWTAIRGSQRLIARTEVAPREMHDRYGFSCFGCCEEIPSGGIEPGGIVFDIGQTPSFEGVEFIHTCTGTTGPFPIGVPSTMTYQSPLSWDGYELSATDLTRQTVSFTETGMYAWVDCSERMRTFTAGEDVRVDKCQEEHAPNINPVKGCFDSENSSDCQSCYSCCDKSRKVGDCRCKGNQVCENGVQAACGKCKERCFGHYNVDCENQLTTCP